MLQPVHKTPSLKDSLESVAHTPGGKDLLRWLMDSLEATKDALIQENPSAFVAGEGASLKAILAEFPADVIAGLRKVSPNTLTGSGF